MQTAIANLTTYNHWANTKLCEWLKTLDPEFLYKETASSFSSIDLTLQHMKNAQNFWYVIITEQDLPEPAETTTTNAFASTTKDFLHRSQKMMTDFAAFSGQQLMHKVTSPVMTRSRYDFIFHVVNHNSYHRGQIITIARFLGITSGIPETDYETFLWFEKQIE